MAMITCPECSKKISDAAEKCPGCGFIFIYKAKKQKKKSHTGEIIGGIIALFIICGFIGNIVSGEKSTQQPVAKPAAKYADQPDYIVSHQHMIEEYDENEIAADNKYRGKIVRITARIEDIGKDITDSAYITFSDNQYLGMRAVQCFFKNSETAKIADVRKGQRVTVQGKVSGLMMNVLVENSVFIDQ